MEPRLFPLSGSLADRPHVHLDLAAGTDLDWQIYFVSGGDRSADDRANNSILHTHDYHEIMIHFSSSCKFFAHDRLFTVGRGNFLLFPAHLPHMRIDDGEQHYRRAYIFLHPRLLAHLPDGAAYARLFAPEAPPVLHLPDETRAALLSRVTSLPDLRTLDAAGQMRLRCLVLELLGELAYAASPAPLRDTLPPPLARATEYIRSNLATLGQSSDLARHLGLSESYLSRLFAEHLQTSPYRYIRNLRLLEARRLLAGGASVTDACFGAGFGDLSHFIAFFRREYGVTPAVWARDARGK